MNNPTFKELLYSYSLDTWLDSEAEEVTSLVTHVYQVFFGHELERNSGKTQEPHFLTPLKWPNCPCRR